MDGKGGAQVQWTDGRERGAAAAHGVSHVTLNPREQETPTTGRGKAEPSPRVDSSPVPPAAGTGTQPSAAVPFISYHLAAAFQCTFPFSS